MTTSRHVEITTPIGGQDHDRHTVVLAHSWGLLIARTGSSVEAAAIRDAWRHNDFKTWPGEWRPFRNEGMLQ